MNPKYYQWIPIVGLYLVMVTPVEDLELGLSAAVLQAVCIAAPICVFLL